MAEDFGRHVLACGGELKNTFCVAKERHVFLSHHIGDLENYETLTSFREGVEHFCRLFDVQPELVAYDLHPEYLSTKYARELEEAGLPAVGVQHHHAHVASCLADNERPGEERVIGVALDGTGYGTDGAVWGGSFSRERRGGVRAARTPGIRLLARWIGGHPATVADGARATRRALRRRRDREAPARTVRRAGERNARLVARLVERSLNTPPTSSAGRLFDAVAAMVGVPGTERTTYEGQAAVELELAADGPASRGYPFRLRPRARMDRGDREIIRGVVEDLLAGRATGEYLPGSTGRWPRSSSPAASASGKPEEQPPSRSPAAPSRTCSFWNQVVRFLEEKGFEIYRHRRVPANDGGLALGQAILADRTSKNNVGVQTRPRADRREATMCLGIPGRIVEIIDEDLTLAKAEVSGVRRNINIGLVHYDEERVEVGDWVLIHVGFAMSKIDESEAHATLRALEDIGEDYEQELEELKTSQIE